MTGRLSEKAVLVTGAASGIGRAITLRFSAEGARVLAVDRDGAGLDRLVDAAPAVAAHVADVSTTSEARGMVDAAVDQFGRLDVIVSNAAIEVDKGIVDHSEAEWDETMAVNLKPTFSAVQHAVPHLESSGGCVVVTASATGLLGHGGMIAYSTSKAALIGLTRSLAADLAPRRIRVNCICPGTIRTPLVARWLEADGSGAAERWAARLHPLGRIGEPDDVANAALFLASDESSFITGHALAVDGGYSTIKVLR